MSTHTQHNNFYYSGGLAEFVAHPTHLTYSFFSYWFRGSTSLGKAMELLGLPYEKISLPIVEFFDGEAVMNLKNEEKTLYAKTIFSYGVQKHLHTMPKLTIDYKKALNPFFLFTTAKLAKKQSEWIAFPQKSVSFGQSLLNTYDTLPSDSLHTLDIQLTDTVWPKVLVIGMLCEFYAQLLEKKYRTTPIWHSLQAYIDAKTAEKDWFFHSILDQKKVKEGAMSFEAYMHEYGNRSDKDYELATPRWSEIADEIQKRIQDEEIQHTHPKVVLPKQGDTALIEAYISLLILRSDAKKHVLPYIAALRKLIITSAKTDDIALLDREQILQGDFSAHSQLTQHSLDTKNRIEKTEGKGQGVSSGNVTGSTYFIQDTHTPVPPKCICIFPNASPEYSLLYPKCEGIIFLKGGQTSHGAIVAREFGIPAVIDPEAKDIPHNTLCMLDGSNGVWKTISY